MQPRELHQEQLREHHRAVSEHRPAIARQDRGHPRQRGESRHGGDRLTLVRELRVGNQAELAALVRADEVPGDQGRALEQQRDLVL